MRVLGIDVPPALLDKWADWLAPDQQPFFLTPQQAAAWGLEDTGREPSREDRDTFLTYAVDSTATVVAWLTEPQFAALDKPIRAQLVRAQVRHGRGAVPAVRAWQGLLGPELKAQADGHRFVWWKSLLAEHKAAILPVIVSEDMGPSRHTEVTRWPTEVPRAQELAGTFADGSGPNCFGSVMAATGVEGADSVWMLREPFEEWLAEHTVPGGRDNEPGTVFVWRNQAGLVQHAAITIGDGWMFHKPAQTWRSPRKVRTVAEVRRSTRTAGWRLTRHRVIG
ncbi:hypothetical protein E1263_14705 [Kribbella antibiotica]|uniref:Uncharacterized protein n=1 Tax=Kribbella antibiotica TaxID=190195 RepID=A0A4V2YPT4_9ACTN|nr:hypothetical protein [Kribbella antibiotica]TDD59437.1 hypothetical protein E1263_14705 [Kribbella antibiotica]